MSTPACPRCGRDMLPDTRYLDWLGLACYHCDHGHDAPAPWLGRVIAAVGLVLLGTLLGLATYVAL